MLGHGEEKQADRDLGGQETVVKIDQESTRAWKGYFDVVIREGAGKQEEPQQEVSLPVSEKPMGASSRLDDAKPREKNFFGTGLDADRDRLHDTSTQMDDIGDQASSTMADSDSGKDAFDDLFGGSGGEQLSLPNTLGDGGQNPTDEAMGGPTGEDPFNALRNAYREPKGKLADFDGLEADTPSSLADTDTEAASSTDSTSSLSRDSTETPPLNGSDRNTQSQRDGDEKMQDRLLRMRAPYNSIPLEAKKEDIVKALTVARMRAPKKYRKITATLLKRLISIDPKPVAFYYDLLFRAHCLPEGSADVIAHLLQEMRKERIHWSSHAYHSVLRVCLPLLASSFSSC